MAEGEPDQPNRPAQSFWPTVGGVLAVVAAAIGLITAVVTLVGAMSAPPGRGGGSGSTTSAAASATRPLTQWVVEANAECRTSTPQIAESLADLGPVGTADPTSTGYRGAVQRAGFLYADLQSRLLSLPPPTEDATRVGAFLARYGERAAQMTLASDRLEQGDVSGHGAALVAFSDIGNRLLPEMADLGLSACP